ncbi:membrane protein, partial [Candidatus Endoriftia persephone str. Guaymas]|nr:membrane protein [Candidatus Endoriftia persephone str. Guaymas]
MPFNGEAKTSVWAMTLLGTLMAVIFIFI